MQLRLRRGQMMFRRLGAVNAVRQRGGGRCPAPHGVWAFPWPVMDLFFAAHKYNEVLPKQFRRDIGVFAPDLALPSEQQLPQTDEEWDAWHRERDAWVHRHRRVLRIRDFWWDGIVYTHLDRTGRYLGFDQWMTMTCPEFAKAVRRHTASPIPGTYTLYRSSDGHLGPARISVGPLEVFLPMHRGGRDRPRRRTA